MTTTPPNTTESIIYWAPRIWILSTLPFAIFVYIAVSQDSGNNDPGIAAIRTLILLGLINTAAITPFVVAAESRNKPRYPIVIAAFVVGTLPLLFAIPFTVPAALVLAYRPHWLLMRPIHANPPPKDQS